MTIEEIENKIALLLDKKNKAKSKGKYSLRKFRDVNLSLNTLYQIRKSIEKTQKERHLKDALKTIQDKNNELFKDSLV